MSTYKEKLDALTADLLSFWTSLAESSSNSAAAAAAAAGGGGGGGATSDIAAAAAAAAGVEGSQAVVFVAGRASIGAVASHLYNLGVSAATLFGGMQQQERRDVYVKFKSSKHQVLVATSVAARGLDFPNVGFVINFDLPPTIEVYVHRIGRTGRAGRTGKAVAYFSLKDRSLASPLIAQLTKAKAPIPPWLDRIAAGGNP